MTSIQNCTVSCTVPRELADAMLAESNLHAVKLPRMVAIALKHFIMTGGYASHIQLMAQQLDKKFTGN